jgi:V/A-type H+-transporting ATPase subunit D
MAKLMTVRPTKIELIRLRRRLVLASRIRKILKDRLSILVMEFLQLARETVEAKRGLISDFSEAYKALSVASGYHGYLALEKELVASEKDLEIITGSRNVAGAKVPSFELRGTDQAAGYSLIDTSSWLDQTADRAGKVLEAIVALAELQSTLEILGKEINRTKRIVNALEYLVIPNLQTTIRFLYMKFEERDREEKARLKRVKVILEKKEQNA